MVTSLLKQYVRLIVEETDTMTLVFQTRDPEPEQSYSVPNFTIIREFPMRLTPDQVTKLNLTPTDLENGIWDTEHVIKIEVDASYHHSTFRGNRWQPPDPDEFYITNWDIVSVDNILLSNRDAQRLKAVIGDLTSHEESDIEEMERQRERDVDPPDDY